MRNGVKSRLYNSEPFKLVFNGRRFSTKKTGLSPVHNLLKKWHGALWNCKGIIPFSSDDYEVPRVLILDFLYSF